MHVQELIRTIEDVADPRLAASWDKSGVQIAGTRDDCRHLAVTLDPLPHIVEQALDWGAECILTHHPLTLAPRLPDRLDDYHQVLRLVFGHGAWLYAAHTSLDVRTDGPAGWLAHFLDLRQCRILEPAGSLPYVQTRLRLTPPELCDRVLAATAKHERCQTLALGGGVIDVTHPKAAWPALKAGIKAVCPNFETVSVASLTSPADIYGYGLIGTLPAPLPYARLLELLGSVLPAGVFRQAGDIPAAVTRLAYCPGSGADMAERAFAADAEVYLTGDLKYHQATAVPHGRLILDVGHFSLEEVMMRVFADDLGASLGANGPQIRFFPGSDPFSAHFPEGAIPPRTE